MMRVRALLPLLLIHSTFAAAAPTNELLTEIRDALTEDYSKVDNDAEDNYDYGWGQANLLSATSKTVSASSDSLAKYWSGASAFGTAGMNDIQKAQTFLDVLLARPYKKFPTTQPKRDDYTNKAKLINGSANKTDVLSIQNAASDFYDSSTPNNAIAEIYFDLYNTYVLARNCKAYWEGGAVERPVPRFVNADSLEKAIERYNNNDTDDCNLGICAHITQQSENPSNGYINVTTTAWETKEKIEKLKCEDFKDDKSKQICGLLQSNADVIYEESNTKSLGSSTAEGYIDSLSNIEATLLQPAQALVIWRFSQMLKFQNTSPEKSFKDIYTPQSQSPLPKCTKTVKNSMYIQCQDKEATSTYDGLDDYVNNLVGLNAVIPPLKPGLPDLEDEDGTHVAVAGQYLAFKPAKDKSYSVSGKVYTKTDTINSVKSLRIELEGGFQSQRNALATDVMQGLLAKTSAIDVIQEVRKQNSDPISFKPRDGKPIKKTSSQVLQESSNWRLKETGDINWLATVSQMSNVSLLREQAVLLAEIKQMLYLQFAANQKQLLLQTLSATSQSIDDPTDITALAASAENYSSGASISTLAPPEPITQDSVNAQVQSAIQDGIDSGG